MAHPIAEREAIFQRGLEAYRAGNHYDAHEIWEELWESEESDDHRRFLQALIQVASAVHKLTHDVGPRGALRLLDSAQAKLEGLPDAYGGVALGRFREGVTRAREEFERLLAEGRRDLAPSLIPPLDRIGNALAWQHRERAAGPDPTQALRRGLAAYQAGRFYDAHAIWEEIRQHEPEGPMRTLLHGLILVAAAMHKFVSMNGPSGALKMLELAEARIRESPEGTCGIAIGELAAEVARAKEAIAQAASGGRAPAPATIAPKIIRARSRT